MCILLASGWLLKVGSFETSVSLAASHRWPISVCWLLTSHQRTFVWSAALVAKLGAHGWQAMAARAQWVFSVTCLFLAETILVFGVRRSPFASSGAFMFGASS